MGISPEKYSNVAIILHWVMAFAFLGMIISGLMMTEDDLLSKDIRFQTYQIHKSTGLVLLVAFFVRLGWRLIHKPPALPDSIKGIEKLAAKAGHWALYLWMILLPLSGWVMVSSSSYGLPTMIYGFFEWPHIPGISGNEKVSESSGDAHEVLAYMFMALIAVHVAAVIKHWVIDKHNFLRRMWFGTFFLSFLFISYPAFANSYVIDHTKSSIAFKGEHAGKEFSGLFESWSAEIHFNPVDLSASKVKVIIKTETAKTGDKMYDGTLPEADWFNSKQYPEAVFESSVLSKDEKGTFTATGDLTIRDITKPVSFTFKYEETPDGGAHVEAQFPLKRLDYGVGQKSDPSAEWVNDDIFVTIALVANRGL